MQQYSPQLLYHGVFYGNYLYEYYNLLESTTSPWKVKWSGIKSNVLLSGPEFSFKLRF